MHGTKDKSLPKKKLLKNSIKDMKIFKNNKIFKNKQRNNNKLMILIIHNHLEDIIHKIMPFLVKFKVLFLNMNLKIYRK